MFSIFVCYTSVLFKGGLGNWCVLWHEIDVIYGGKMSFCFCLSGLNWLGIEMVGKEV